MGRIGLRGSELFFGIRHRHSTQTELLVRRVPPNDQCFGQVSLVGFICLKLIDLPDGFT